MKKIISLIAVAVFSITALCIPSFAYSGKFENYFQLDYLKLNTKDTILDSGTDHTNLSFYVVGEDAAPIEFDYYHIYFKYYGQSLQPGERFIATVRIVVNEGSVGSYNKLPSASIQAKINSASYRKVGSVSVTHEYVDYSNIYYLDCFIDITLDDYLNKGDTIFSVGVNHNGEKGITTDFRVTFDQNVSDVYTGSADAPEAPNYNNPQDSIGQDTNDLKNQEDKLMQDTEQGRESTLSLFAGLADLITELSIPLMAISALFNYFVGNSILNSVLQISLTLGLLAFVFNLGQSLISRSNNQRGQKQNNKKGGG